VTLPAQANRGRWWVRLPPILRAFQLAALSLAAAGPRIGGDTVEIKKEGIAIVIAIDISSSMLAEDFAPSNRLEVAKRQAVGFIRGGRRPDRSGGLCRRSSHPGTGHLDYPVIEQAVMDLKIGSLEDGTAIGSGLATAVNRLRRAPDKSKVVLLLYRRREQQGADRSPHRGRDGVRVRNQGLHHRCGYHRRGPIPTGADWAAFATSCCRCGSTSRSSGDRA
jgi:Ca-activated chloride channel family protein